MHPICSIYLEKSSKYGQIWQGIQFHYLQNWDNNHFESFMKIRERVGWVLTHLPGSVNGKGWGAGSCRHHQTQAYMEHAQLEAVTCSQRSKCHLFKSPKGYKHIKVNQRHPKKVKYRTLKIDINSHKNTNCKKSPQMTTWNTILTEIVISPKVEIMSK